MMVFMSFNSYSITTGATSGAGSTFCNYLSGALSWPPVFSVVSVAQSLSFLCSISFTIIGHHVLFLLSIVLSVLLRSMAVLLGKQWRSHLVSTARFWNNLHQVHSKPKYLKAKLKVLGAIKPKGLNRIANIWWGHLCLREENISFNNNYIIKER